MALWGHSIIGSGSGFTVNLGSDLLGKSNDFRLVKCESDSVWIQIHCESGAGSDNRIRTMYDVAYALLTYLDRFFQFYL